MGDLEGGITLLLLLALVTSLCIPGGNCSGRRTRRGRAAPTPAGEKPTRARLVARREVHL